MILGMGYFPFNKQCGSKVKKSPKAASGTEGRLTGEKTLVRESRYLDRDQNYMTIRRYSA